MACQVMAFSGSMAPPKTGSGDIRNNPGTTKKTGGPAGKPATS